MKNDKEFFEWYFCQKVTPYYSIVFLNERFKPYCYNLPWLRDLDRRILSGEIIAIGKVHIIFTNDEPKKSDYIKFLKYKNEINKSIKVKG